MNLFGDRGFEAPVKAGALLSYTQQSCDRDAMKLCCAPPPCRVLATAFGPRDFRPLNSVSSVSNSILRADRQRAKSGAPKEIGPDGTALIKRFEGCARLRRDGLVEAYPDPATGGEPWTIGWGATGKGLTQGERIGPDSVWTQKDCDLRFAFYRLPLRS